MSATKDGFSTFFQWFAWTIAIGASVFFMIYVVGDEIPKVVAGQNKEFIAFLACLLVAVTGCVLSFFRKTTGALLMFIGGVGMTTYLYIHGGLGELRMMIVYGAPYILSALLLIVISMRKR